MRSKSAPNLLLVPLSLLALSACGTEAGSDGEMAEDAAASSPDGTAAAPGDALLDLPNPFGERVQGWGSLPDERSWGAISAIYRGPAGERIWVAERCGANSCEGSSVDPVVGLDPEGNVQVAFGAGDFVRPHGIFVDAEGNVWIADDQGPSEEAVEEDPAAANRGHQVIKYSPEGEILMTLGTAGEVGDPPERLTRPSDVVVADNGDIFVAEGHSSETAPARISKFSADGTFIQSWGELGSGPGEFRTAHALAIDARGRLLVADRGNNRVQVFSQDGEFLEEWPQFGRPNDVYVDENDVVYTVDAQSDEETNPGMLRGVYIGDAESGELTGFLPASPDWESAAAEGLVTDADGNLYLGHIGSGGVTKHLR